ncbi:hypothetical protein B7494_g37 [Chlorociboria aeruginascens]|nr:hypothetical protein B7494_g37 [Chlorociboria aeruginascens]
MDESNPELESFRQKWRAEVSAKSRGDNRSRNSNAGPSKVPKNPPNTKIGEEKVRILDEEQDHVDPPSFHDLDAYAEVENADGESSQSRTGSREPRSALEHYEKAVERESQGSLGDSLNLYRKAFRVRLSSLSQDPTNSSSLITASIRKGTPPPPCPLANLPSEILVQIFTEVAILDLASFVRCAQVCKRLAYLVATDEQIWKRVCLGREVGFAGMHYSFAADLLGGPLIPENDSDSDLEAEDPLDIPISIKLTPESITTTLLSTVYSNSWHQMFRFRPRIRFNGCYISTVNYIRPGQASPSQITWNSPVHIVTYYRYLRFFRDGTVISLQTTTEPVDVVHYLTKELQDLHRGGASSHLPSAFMSNALRGRWKLSSINDTLMFPQLETNLKNSEGELIVETEGAAEIHL